MYELPPLRILPVFEAVARLNSFSRAAEELHVTQSAVSHSIRQLEDHLGEALFLRAGRQLSLTEAGQRYYDDIASALKRIERASDRLRGRPDRRVRLALPSSLAVCWLIPRLKDFETRFPEIDLDLEMLSDMPPMSGRIADCFLTIRYRQRGYESRSLYVERLFAICSPRYWQRLKGELAERGLIDPANPGPLKPEWLLDCRLLSAASVFEREGEDWRRWFAAADMAMPPDLRLQHFSHMLLAHEAARHDQGIALANDYMVDAEHDPGLVRLPCHDFRTGDEFHFAYKQARREEPAIRALSGWLMGQARESGWAPHG
jgi:LysR family transcriptional regulator, glycine cleavage system transcriptional activator